MVFTFPEKLINYYNFEMIRCLERSIFFEKKLAKQYA